jgi:hypothetical protein
LVYFHIVVSPLLRLFQILWRSSENAGPWKWHLEETYKALVPLSIEALKILALANGGVERSNAVTRQFQAGDHFALLRIGVHDARIYFRVWFTVTAL